ncbi:MAG: ABC transporter substrate-binding protein [Candidatus Woesearchaeota archaeon]
MKKIIWLIFAMLIVGCTMSKTDNLNTEPIKIGAVLPLQASPGYGTQNGENSLKGYQLAIEEINAEGGVNGRKLELVVEDHKSGSTQEAISAYRALRGKSIDIILGPNYAPLGQAIAPIACNENVLIVSPAIGSRDFAASCANAFNVWPADYGNSKSLGKLVVEGGYERIAIVGSRQSWEEEQASAVNEGVEEANGNIVEYMILINDATTMQAEATKIIAATPDAVIFTNYGYMPLLAKKLRDLGYTRDFFAVVIDESRREPAQGAFEGAIAVTTYTPTAEFMAKFEKRFSVKPDLPADTSYDAIMLVAKAMRETHSTDVNLLAEYLSGVKEYSGASGPFRLGDDGGAIKNPAFIIVQNDTIVEYVGVIKK